MTMASTEAAVVDGFVVGAADVAAQNVE